MTAAGVGETQRQPHAGEVRIHGDDLVRKKIDVDRPAECAGKLVHKTAGLAEVQVLRLLRHSCDGDRLQLAVIEQLVKYPCDKHRVRSRGAESRSGGKRAAYDGVKAAEACAQVEHRTGDAPNQRLGGAELLRMHVKIRELHLDVGEALGFYPDDIFVIRRHRSVQSLVHRRGEDAPLLMVGVIARKLGPAGRKEFFHKTLRFRLADHFLASTFSAAAQTASASSPYLCSSSP